MSSLLNQYFTTLKALPTTAKGGTILVISALLPIAAPSPILPKEPTFAFVTMHNMLDMSLNQARNL